MKILYHHRTRSKDGQFVHIEELTKALKARGHEIIMVGPAAIEEEDFGADAGFVATLKKYLPRWIYEIAELSYALFAYRRLAKACREHQPDCLYERYNLFMPAGVWLKRRFGLPMLLEVNAPLAEERARFDGLSMRRLAGWVQRYTWRGADRVLPISKVMAGYIGAVGVPDCRMLVIHNGIDPDVFRIDNQQQDIRQHLGLDDAVIIGFTGFMREWHGLDRVLDFMAAYRGGAKLHFLLVGDGPARSGLERKILDFGLSDKVTFVGVVDRHAVPAYVASFDISVLTIEVPHSSPLKMPEYMAVGSAIIAPTQPSLCEILVDGVNAALYDPEFEGAFEAAFSRLVEDNEYRTTIGAAAARTVAERDLTWPGNARRVEKLFQTLGVAG